MRDADATITRLCDYEPPPYRIDEIALVFSLNPDALPWLKRSIR